MTLAKIKLKQNAFLVDIYTATSRTISMFSNSNPFFIFVVVQSYEYLTTFFFFCSTSWNEFPITHSLKCFNLNIYKNESIRSENVFLLIWFF